jgi:hypothetical protein
MYCFVRHRGFVSCFEKKGFKMKSKITTLIFFASLLLLRPVFACDLCSIYNATRVWGETLQGFYLGAAEQFTHFGTLQDNGHVVPNPVGQFLDSSNSQMFLGYNFTDRIGLQLTVPFIHRSFQRPVGFDVQRGQVNGFGDIPLLGKFIAIQKYSQHFNISWGFLAGIKLPTGNSDFLLEELNEEEVDGAPESGVHGHDLTLGSGSFDGVLGSNLTTGWRRFLLTADIQYAIRSRGRIGYRFANDLQWNVGLGAYFFLNHTFTLAGQARVSGEHKGLDNLNGEPAVDTGITSVYLGPNLLFTWKNHLSASVGGDIPLVLDNTAFQIVPDYKIRGGVNWNF